MFHCFLHSQMLRAVFLLVWLGFCLDHSVLAHRKTVSTADAAESIKKQCRQFPTWKRGTDEEGDFHMCSIAMHYEIDDAYLLEGSDDEFSEEKSWIESMRTCINDKGIPKIDPATIRDPRITNLLPSKQEALMATVSFALADHEAQAVLALSQCVREKFHNQFDHRSFYEEDQEDSPEERGGNDCVFMAGFLQMFLPGVAAQIYRVAHMVWKEAGWDSAGKNATEAKIRFGAPGEDVQPLPNPYDCGIRTTEHLDYNGWAKLGRHVDGESHYTVLIAFSDPDDYEGGEYFLEPSTWSIKDNSRVVVKPARLSAVVFQSEQLHGVQKILGGRRQMFTTELWHAEDVEVGGQRPDPADYEFEDANSEDDGDEEDDDDAEEKPEENKSDGHEEGSDTDGNTDGLARIEEKLSERSLHKQNEESKQR